MNSKMLQTLLIASVLSPAVAFAQTAKTRPTTATYITKEEINLVSKSQQSQRSVDENTKIVDLGYEHFTVGVSHHASTRTPAPAAPAGGNAGVAAPAPTCGRRMATLPPGGTPDGNTHVFQTEGYYIVSGGGTIFTDGYIVNGLPHTNDGPGGLDGPSCEGMAYDVKKVVVKAGDVIIIPAGVVHGWADVPDHVDYLSFRPEQKLFRAGWVNPTIAK
jgi:hypothetical protein